MKEKDGPKGTGGGKEGRSEDFILENKIGKLKNVFKVFY